MADKNARLLQVVQCRAAQAADIIKPCTTDKKYIMHKNVDVDVKFSSRISMTEMLLRTVLG